MTGRWGAHTRTAGRTLWVPIAHPMWPLFTAEVAELDDELVVAAGIQRAGQCLRPLFSPGVRVGFGRPSRVA